MPNARKGPVDRGNDRVIIQSDISVNLAVVAAHSDASWRRGEIRKRGGRPDEGKKTRSEEARFDFCFI